MAIIETIINHIVKVFIASINVMINVINIKEHPHPATFIGPGKAKEVAKKVTETAADVVIFDDELSLRHQRTSAQVSVCERVPSSMPP